MKRVVSSILFWVCIVAFSVCAFGDDLDQTTGSSITTSPGAIITSESAISADVLEVETLVVGNMILQSTGDPDDELPDEPSQVIGQYGYYIVVNIPSIGNNLTLVVPANYRDNYFAVDDDGYIYNCSSSTITCYTGIYTVRFPSYSSPQTRRTNPTTGEQWIDRNITYVSSGNVSVLGANTLWWSDFGYPLIIFGLLGVIAICLFIKR